MDENTEKLIKERFDALPESIREVILSSNYEETLIEIGKKYLLNVEQMGTLERETTMTMMGLIPTKNFEAELTRELGVDKLKGSQITAEINEKVFLKIRELLKLINGETEEKPSTEESTEIKNPTQENKEEHEIMKSAGIEILHEKENMPVPDLPATTVVQAGKLEIAGEVTPQPIFAQKFVAPVQSQTIKTEHTLENISKTEMPNTPNINTEKPKIDPYREIPE